MLLGVGGILAGDNTGYEWLEFPPYAAIVLFVAYSLVMSWAVLMFRFRRGGAHLHHAMVFARRVPLVPVALRRRADHVFVVPVQGVMQAAVNWWFANNLLFPLAWCDWTWHRLLHDSESDRASGVTVIIWPRLAFGLTRFSRVGPECSDSSMDRFRPG